MRTIILFIGLLFLLLYSSCKTNESNAKKTAQEGTNLGTGLIEGPTSRANSTYQGIKTNIARLHAMFNAKYVQYFDYSAAGEPANFEVWRVNDGQDSMMLYTFPVGDPNKVGYWSYHFQVMTSLIEEPIFTRFEHFEAISRDSIKTTFYNPPEGFNPSLETLLKKKKTAFKDVNLKKLSLAKDAGALYVRNNPLSFTDRTIESTSGEWTSFTYSCTVEPDGMDYTLTRKNDSITDVKVTRFVKLGMIR